MKPTKGTSEPATTPRTHLRRQVQISYCVYVAAVVVVVACNFYSQKKGYQVVVKKNIITRNLTFIHTEIYANIELYSYTIFKSTQMIVQTDLILLNGEITSLSQNNKYKSVKNMHICMS